MGGQTSYRTKLLRNGVEIAECENVKWNGVDVESIDVTPLNGGDNFLRKIPGNVDPGQLTVDLIFDPTDSGQVAAALTGVNEENPANRTATWGVRWGVTGVTDTCAGFFKGVDKTAAKGDKLVASITIELSGKPSWSP